MNFISKTEAFLVFEEERKELEEDENMSDNGFAQYILDKVEEAVDTQSF